MRAACILPEMNCGFRHRPRLSRDSVPLEGETGEWRGTSRSWRRRWAQRSSAVPDVGGGAFGAARLCEILRQRLEPASGRRPGRPTDPGWDRRPKVPMSSGTETKLAELARLASGPGRKVSPMQVAAFCWRRRLPATSAIGRSGVVREVELLRRLARTTQALESRHRRRIPMKEERFKELLASVREDGA
jgi:hypothetical protein